MEDYISEWTRDGDLKIFNKNNILVAAGIEPALLLVKTEGYDSMLAKCCDFIEKVSVDCRSV